jgi:ABC-2 type transport system ATP-binding protein
MSNKALEVHNATKTFGKNGQHSVLAHLRGRATAKKKSVVAVDNLSLTVKRGEIFGILGPNGSGKSTLVRLVSTLMIPDTGEIRVFGHDVQTEEATVKRMINRVSVDAAFFKKLSPMENLMYAARLYGVNARRARQQIVEILTRLGIEERSINEPLEEMSRGMQQKVAIARAFLSSPILLLLDEPTTGLDPRSKREVQTFVREIQANHNTTMLLTTHDMNEAEELCDRIAIIDKGRIVAMDTPNGLKAAISNNGHPVTLEDVFMAMTGRQLTEENGDNTSP